MANIPIHNETDYPLTDAMTQYILRDAQEHFGEEVHAIRVQSGLERHSFNARTHEVRYAFSPQDFGFGHTMPSTPEPMTPEPSRSRWRFSRRGAEPEAAILPAALDDVETEDAEEEEPLETSLDSLDEGRDEDDEEDEVEDVFTLDDQNEAEDEDDEDKIEDDEDDQFFDPDEHGV